MRKQWAAGNRCSEPEGPGDAPSGKRVDRRQEVGWGGWGKGDERTSSAAFTSECHYFSWLSQHNKLKCLWFTWDLVDLLLLKHLQCLLARIAPAPELLLWHLLHESLLWNLNFSAGNLKIEVLLVHHKCLYFCQWSIQACFRLLLWWCTEGCVLVPFSTFIRHFIPHLLERNSAGSLLSLLKTTCQLDTFQLWSWDFFRYI